MSNTKALITILSNVQYSLNMAQFLYKKKGFKSKQVQTGSVNNKSMKPLRFLKVVCLGEFVLNCSLIYDQSEKATQLYNAILIWQQEWVIWAAYMK